MSFMDEECFESCVETMRLPNGEPFPLPVVFQVDRDIAKSAMRVDAIDLVYRNRKVAVLRPIDIFSRRLIVDAEKIFGTTDMDHPGVRFFAQDADCNWFIAGAPEQFESAGPEFGEYELTPTETRALFASLGWKTIVGFQTRNVPHRAHEYLQRVALEFCDGLLVQPLVGRRKRGDYTPEAILAGYRALIESFYPADRVKLAILTTSMRYAGPREAVFHAIIRRNYGCTHFVVGRDHAGVGGYYGMYDAHRLTEKFEGELGITILRLHGPFHCKACDGIVTEKTCPHATSAPDVISHIAGTDMRAILTGGQKPERHLMRPEIVEALQGVPLFIEEDSE